MRPAGYSQTPSWLTDPFPTGDVQRAHRRAETPDGLEAFFVPAHRTA
jgi:hypothetical protein